MILGGFRASFSACARPSPSAALMADVGKNATKDVAVKRKADTQLTPPAKEDGEDLAVKMMKAETQLTPPAKEDGEDFAVKMKADTQLTPPSKDNGVRPPQRFYIHAFKTDASARDPLQSSWPGMLES